MSMRPTRGQKGTGALVKVSATKPNQPSTETRIIKK